MVPTRIEANQGGDGMCVLFEGNKPWCATFLMDAVPVPRVCARLCAIIRHFQLFNRHTCARLPHNTRPLLASHQMSELERIETEVAVVLVGGQGIGASSAGNDSDAGGSHRTHGARGGHGEVLVRSYRYGGSRDDLVLDARLPPLNGHKRLEHTYFDETTLITHQLLFIIINYACL